MTIIATVPGPAHLRPLRARLLDAVVARIVALHDADPTGLRRHIQSAVRQEFAAQLGARRLVALEPGEVEALLWACDAARGAAAGGRPLTTADVRMSALTSALARLRDDAHGPGSSASTAQVRASTLRDDVAAIARRTDAAGPAGPSGPSDSPTHG